VFAFKDTWCSCFTAGFACYSWCLPPSRWLGAERIVERRLVIVFGSYRGDCEGFLTFPWWRAKRYSSGLLVACVIFILCWSPYWGFGVWCQLAHELLSEWIATTRTNLPASKWTSVKKVLCHLYPRILLVVLWLIDWLTSSSCNWLISLHVGIIIAILSCITFLVCKLSFF
jgi:hypothetical protein